MKKLTKNCLHCGNLFEKKINCSLKDWNTRTKFCSKNCSNKNKKFEIKICKFCKINPVKRQGKIYCSRKCSSESNKGSNNNMWKGGQIQKRCVMCNTEFSIDPYLKDINKCCSKKCQIEYRRSPEFRKKQSIRARKQILEQYGESPKFITSLELIIRESAKYRLWREAVWKRDKYTCQICKKTGKICADHIISFIQILLNEDIKTYDDSQKDESKLWDISNGRTLCFNCHYKTENYGFKAIKTLKTNQT